MWWRTSTTACSGILHACQLASPSALLGRIVTSALRRASSARRGLVRAHQRGRSGSCFGLLARQDVPVGVQRETYGGVTETLTHDLALTPAPRRCEACVCLRSCKRTAGTPTEETRRRKAW